MSSRSGDDIPVQTLAETENYIAWRSDEPDGEAVFHIEFGSVTVHFFQEEWDELLDLMAALAESGGGQPGGKQPGGKRK